VAVLNLEAEGLNLKTNDNGDGTVSLTVHTGGVGVADQSLEIQGVRIQMHDNGDGTFSPVTTASTGASDISVEWQGLRLKLHPTGVNDPNTKEPMYAIVVVTI
jgi:hypothetical protein